MIKKFNLVLISCTLCLLTACQGPDNVHTYLSFIKDNAQSYLYAGKISSRLRAGLFNSRDNASLINVQRECTHEEPQILWTKMRHSFEFIYPEHHPRVKKYTNEYSKSNYYTNKLSENASPFLHMIVEEIEKRGMPIEIALLPMIESNFEPTAVSHTGAHGLWQIMPATGKVLGLKQDYWYDGRRDVKASTIAALNHLQYLHRSFDGDWLLALAAYNSGQRRVVNAISRNERLKKPTDFWHLKLPKETQNYVPKLLAMISIVKNPSKYGVVLPSIPNKPYAQMVQVNQQIDLKIAASLAQVDYKYLAKLNPAFHHGTTHPKGPHQLYMPIDNTQIFIRQLRRSDPNNLVNAYRYKIKAGDNLASIAKLFKTGANHIKEINDLKSDTIHPGQYLFIPTQSKALATQVTHIVKAGDSLWSISKEYKIDVNELISWNKLNAEIIKPGQKLIIYQT